MKSKKINHMSELLFTVTLFAIFLISGVLSVLFGANVYQKTTSESAVNETIRTSLSYIQEKVRQCDHEASVEVETHHGINTLTLHNTYGTEQYVTYIYYDNGQLKELFTKSDLGFQPASGDSITTIDAFTITQDNSLIHIVMTDSKQQAHELYIHASSAN